MAEDIREDYGKTQSAGFALCSRTVYCVIFTENDSLHRIISLRIGGMEVRLVVNDKLAGTQRFDRCKDLFEDFCVVSASIRKGIPIKISVEDEKGQILHSSE